MPESAYLVAAVAISAAVTWTLRAVPFAVLAPLRRSRLVPYLAATMPVGVMLTLVVYTLRDVVVSDPWALAAPAIAVAATVGLHLWRRTMLLSIIGGTAVHVVLASLVFT